MELSDREYLIHCLEQMTRDHVPREKGSTKIRLKYDAYMQACYLYLLNFLKYETCDDDDILDVLERKRKEFYNAYDSKSSSEKTWFLGTYEDSVCYVSDILLARKYNW